MQDKLNELNNLSIFTCQCCKKKYQTDGKKKPKSFKKDGSIHQYYDSSLYCSKECSLKEAVKKFKQTIKKNPDIIKERIQKYKKTIKDNPEIIERLVEKRKETYKNNPEVKRRSIEKYKLTLRNNPEILIKRVQKRRQTYKDNPNIIKRSIEKHKKTLRDNPEIIRNQVEKRKETYKETYKNNPEIMEDVKMKISKTLKNTYKNSPEIQEQARKKQRQTYINHPEIIERSIRKRYSFYQNHPEILEKSRDEAYKTAKRHGFISEPEQKMIQLLKDKYGENDVIEQYRDDRYKKPGTNYRYACDCYIKSLDLFIEYNGSRFHPTEEDRTKLEQEMEKFKLKYPSRNIKECQAYALLKTIENDKIKQQVARDNKLNYLVINEYNLQNFKDLF